MSVIRPAAKSIALSVPAVRRLYRELLAANEKLTAVAATNADLQLENMRLREELNARKVDVVACRGELEARTSETASLRSETASLRSDIESRSTEIVSLRGELDRQNIEIAALRGELDRQNVENTALRGDLEARRSENVTLHEEIAELERSDRNIHGLLVARNAENAYLQAELLAVKGDPEGRLLPGFEWHLRGFDWSRESGPTPFWVDRIAMIRGERLRRKSALSTNDADRSIQGAVEDYEFSEDWFSQHVRNWELVFRECVIDAKKILEIGSYEGRSTVWLIEHGFNPDHGGDLYCIDTWLGAVEHIAPLMPKVEARFDRNVARARKHATKVNVHKIRGTSPTSLMKLLVDGHHCSFDFIYVDASHIAADVLTDLVLAFALCRVGGIIACDDYLYGNPLHGPKMAIDAFLNCFFGKVEPLPGLLLYQLFLRKLADGPVPQFPPGLPTKSIDTDCGDTRPVP